MRQACLNISLSSKGGRKGFESCLKALLPPPPQFGGFQLNEIPRITATLFGNLGSCRPAHLDCIILKKFACVIHGVRRFIWILFMFLFPCPVYCANSLVYSVTHSSRQRQHSLLYASNVIETNCSDVQYPTTCCDQSSSYSVPVTGVYKVNSTICNSEGTWGKVDKYFCLKKYSYSASCSGY